MSLNLSVPDRTAELKPKIVVFGTLKFKLM